MHGKKFKIYKFRTMYANQNETFKLTVGDNDSRLTKAGKVLRRYHLDELPQIINVVLGDMSFVGPRPVPNELYEYYIENIPDYDARHIVRPGITGLAQVTQGYTNTLAQEKEKHSIDLTYIQQMSFLLDFKILLTTLFRGFRIL